MLHTKLATAGAGGVPITVWALRPVALAAAEVASGMVWYEILNYGVYMAVLAIGAFGLWTGLFSGQAPTGLTLVPALFGTTVIIVVVSMLCADEPASGTCSGEPEPPVDVCNGGSAD